MYNINNTIEKYEILLKELLNSEIFSIEDINKDYKNIKKINSKHNVKGVYLIIDEKDNFAYVGKTKSKTILDRVGNQHVYGNAGSDLKIMVGKPPLEDILKYRCKYIRIDHNIERSRFEYFVIAILNPYLNK